MSEQSALSRLRRAPWDGIDVAMVLVVSFLLELVAYAAVSQTMHLLDGGLSGQDRSVAEALAAQLAFYAAGLSATLLVLFARRRQARVADLGWRMTSRGWVLAALPLTVLALGIASLLTGVAQTLMPHTENAQCLSVRSDYGSSVLLALPVVAVAAPIVEETVFRGVVYRWLRGVMPVNLAMGVSAAVFAGAHFIRLLLLPLFGLGILLAWIYERSGSIWPGVLVHALFNLVGVVAILTARGC